MNPLNLMHPLSFAFVVIIMLAACGQAVPTQAKSLPDLLPDPARDEPRAAAPASATIILAGGCFWGVEGVFEHVRGVTAAVSGYTGGAADAATYDAVRTGTTGHAEAVQVMYDPSQITLGQLLKIYFSVAHDPTEVNRQGPDRGTQYRSAIFTVTPAQKDLAQSYVTQLQAARSFEAPIATQIGMLDTFYPAEAYHQGYLQAHPHNPYIMINDAPKVAALREQFPALYRE